MLARCEMKLNGHDSFVPLMPPDCASGLRAPDGPLSVFEHAVKWPPDSGHWHVMVSDSLIII